MIRVTLRQMEYFDALAQTLHFGRAAELMGVSQPALSSQVAEMEERLGCMLFDRSGRVVRMTGEAEELRPRIERILAEVREMEAAMHRDRLAMAGRFRLGIIPTVAPFLLPAILPELKRRHPSLLIEIREAVTAALVEETSAGRLDGFIAALPLDFPSIAAQELFCDRFFLAVPAADPHLVAPPVAPESAVLERLMLLEDGHCMRDQALAVCGRVRPATMTSYRATSLTTLLQMVSHGLGVTLLPEMALEPAQGLRGVRVLPFIEPAPSRTVCLAWRRNGPRQGECLELAGFIRAIHGGAPAPAPGADAEMPMPS
ncbi:hydrogen peroxide-inducible genes activator [Mesorhizobium sp. PUT5]|uniref:hydrogen peroxide-inducible genes activator n=1 Tax=Mesorhizobium sp. PUT5 TaxID=3454629 RepID=UPI003FA40AEA